MTLADEDALFATLDLTWPAAGGCVIGPWRLRRGEGGDAGGGRRTNAATLDPEAAPGPALERFGEVEAQMRDWGQTPLIQVRDSQGELDESLAARGYAAIEPTAFYACPVAPLASRELPRLAAFALWPPLEVQLRLWEEGGIGADRMAVMERAAPAKTALLARDGDEAAGTGFVAVKRGVAVIHAMHVRPDRRRRGLCGHMVACAARWAVDQGAEHMTLAVGRANDAAIAAYGALGMVERPGYRYRRAPADRSSD